MANQMHHGHVCPDLHDERAGIKVNVMKGLTYGSSALSATDPEKIYSFSKCSYELLEGARKLKYKADPSMVGIIIMTIHKDLENMWKFKYDIYNKDKSAENLKELKEIASKRMLFAQFFMTYMKTDKAFNFSWRIQLDLVSITAKVYGHYSCAKKYAENVFDNLKPSDIAEFNRIAPIQFENAFRGKKQIFVEALLEKFNPKIVKIKNPFLDGSDFESFFAFYYGNLPNEILANADLTTPINIYKFMLLSLIAEPYNRGEISNFNSSHAAILYKIKDVKAKYKKFLNQEISLTSDERKYVRSAYATVRLAGMSLEVMKNGFKLEDFDFHKFKELCNSLLEGFSGEVSIDYLHRLFDYMKDKNYFEVSRFIASVMIEILRKSQTIRAENGTILQNCPCVAIKLMEIDMDINHMNWDFLDERLYVSNVIRKLGPFECYKIIAKDVVAGKMLMEIFDNYEGDNADFHKVPLRAGNYEQAKLMYEMIVKLTTEREELWDLRHADDKLFNQGYSGSNFAGFINDTEEKYKILEQCSNFLIEGLEKNPAGLLGFASTTLKMSLEALDYNLRRMWKIKQEIYNSDKTEENRIAMKTVARNRIKWGEFYVIHYKSGFEYERWLTHLDMFKCHLQVFGNQSAARSCAESIWDLLVNDPSEIVVFSKHTEIRFNKNIDKSKLVKSLFSKYK